MGWSDIYKYVHVQLAYSHFNNQMKTYFHHHFPIQQTKIKYSNRNEWINKALKNEIIERERLFIYNKKYPTQENIDVYKICLDAYGSQLWPFLITLLNCIILHGERLLGKLGVCLSLLIVVFFINSSVY